MEQKKKKATQLTCLECVKPRPVRRMHLGGVGPRAHVGENHNPFFSMMGQTIQSWFLPLQNKKP